jgi:hypothetical protein
MKVITDEAEVARHKELVSEMTIEQGQFRPEWVHRKGWKVVPVETGMCFSEDDIKGIVSGLRKYDISEGFTIATEPLDPLPVCYSLSITEEDFQEFNRTCGLFWFFITDERRSWAISCNNTYNLFAGPPELLEAMLGKSIAEARDEYLSFATALAKEPDEPLLQVAKHYAAL